ncbi:MAG: YdcF family protein [Planctomycetes bacterium]|nr:YdcF family protein [Planctomycetota bacterium]
MVDAFLLPPGVLLLAALLAFVVRRRRPLLARALAWSAVSVAYLLSTPLVSGALLGALEGRPPDALPKAGEAQAIVVLGGDVGGRTPGEARPEVGPLTLERVRHAARIARETGLPLLVTGGTTRPDTPPVGRLMSEALARDFGLPTRWIDDRARTTWENAERAADLLRADGVTRVLLVTHAFHMPRALAAFARTGLLATPAPFAFHDEPLRWPDALLPGSGAFRASCLALHEWIGRAFYALRTALD